MILVDLLERDSLVSNITKVAVDTGLLKSDVLSTLSNPKLTFAAVPVTAPVPPELIGKTPASLFAVSVKSE